MAARLGVTGAVFWLLLMGIVHAQQYQHLHVLGFTLSSDDAHPRIETPFHVSLTIRVAEKQFNGDNVFLPSFEGAEELGDLRQVLHDARGTTYRETLTLVAHARGSLHVSEAYLDAIDARDGKPKRFLSNSLTLPVGGGPVTRAWNLFRTLLLVVIAFVLFAAAVAAIALVQASRRKLPPIRAAEPPAAVVAGRQRDEVEEAFTQLRHARNRRAVLALRSALWLRAGADPGATLNDVLVRTSAHRLALRHVLVAVERAAFVEDARLNDAIEEILCSPQL
ncbi:MAG TPA: hypothetical protein VIO32_05605 [Candidatus Baltobacteraceae bacterium]